MELAEEASQEAFKLAPDIVVQNCELKEGLLTLSLLKVIPEEKKRKQIKIR